MGKPGFLRQWGGGSKAVVYLLAILLLGLFGRSSYGASPPQGEPAKGTGAPGTGAAAATEDTSQRAFKPPAPPSPEMIAANNQIKDTILKEGFVLPSSGMADPFVSFFAPETVSSGKGLEPETGDDSEIVFEPDIPRHLTPLQRMKIVDIERGLRAITWGEMGRRALIEDSAGKGYIVTIGTPVGDMNGVVAQIFNDHLVIQQDIWDKESKRMVPQSSVVKLLKEKKE